MLKRMVGLVGRRRRSMYTFVVVNNDSDSGVTDRRKGRRVAAGDSPQEPLVRIPANEHQMTCHAKHHSQQNNVTSLTHDTTNLMSLVARRQQAEERGVANGEERGATLVPTRNIIQLVMVKGFNFNGSPKRLSSTIGLIPQNIKARLARFHPFQKKTIHETDFAHRNNTNTNHETFTDHHEEELREILCSSK